MIFGHLPELFIVLLLALLVFGPKRMIDMGSSFGKAFREFRSATKDLSWSNLLTGGDDEKPSPLSQISQLSQTFGSAKSNGTASANGPSNGTPADAETVTATTRVVDAGEPGEEPGAN